MYEVFWLSKDLWRCSAEKTFLTCGNFDDLLLSNSSPLALLTSLTSLALLAFLTFLAPFFNCPAQNEDFGLVERGPAGPQNQNLPDESINIGLSVDPFRPMHVIHFPKAIICIYKPNQKLDGGG